MNFDEWMRSKGLSEATVTNYYTAIKGSLSDWARNARLIDGSILDIRDQSKMSSLVLNLKALSIVQERDDKGHGMYVAALKKYSRFLYEIRGSSYEDDIKTLINDSSIAPTDRLQLINARIGQGQYRKNLLSIRQSCSATGYDNTSLLVASHIKPWSKSSNAERLDPYNGLLLIPNLDRAFDQGLITFDKNGKVLISSKLSNPQMLGISPDMDAKLLPQQHEYMEYHRQLIFEK